MRTKSILWLGVLIIAMIFSACSSTGGNELKIDPAPEVNVKLQSYDGDFFSMKLPKGWEIHTVGEYENFGFRAYDPDKPSRQIFFYGNMKYFMKSSEGKEAWNRYMAEGGYADAGVYADAPVLSPATTEEFYNTFDEFTSYAKKYGIDHDFPVFNDLEILETTPRNSPIASNCIEDSILRVLFKNDDIPCEGLFAAGVADTMTSYMYDVDAGYYTVYVITGISAPADEFYQLKDTLLKSLSSFRYTDRYVEQGVARSRWGTEMALQVGRTLSEAADSYNEAWSNRQRVNDALSQKRSDATMGYDRLYDTETGEVYRAELGFYDQYDTHREEFENIDLQPVPDDDYDLYEKEIKGYIYK